MVSEEDGDDRIGPTQSLEDMMMLMSQEANQKAEFKDTIYENFFGEKVVEVKLVSPDGLSKKVNSKKEKMGAIYLNINSGKLYEAWE